MKIAIIGATSQIAKDMIAKFEDEHALLLFSRKPTQVKAYMERLCYTNYLSFDYNVLDGRQFYVDAVINFVGAGDPARVGEMKDAIFDVTKKFDNIAMQFLRRPETKYIFISSGAAYGGTFDQPARYGEKVTYPQEITPKHYYGLAKWITEIRHRTLFKKHIVDLRLFNYISRTMPLHTKFMVTEMLNAIERQRTTDATPYAVDNTEIWRDFIGPDDLFNLIDCILSAPGFNGVVDAYTQAPIDKHTLLDELHKRYGLCFAFIERIVQAPTGVKPKYYSENYTASKLGYQPRYTSLETIFKEADYLLDYHDPGSQS